ncbi:DUF885 domain-containing protein [Sphingomonas immobilis]|uniref:DUF885 family protein n=1 Tax=Sphingomonas immobilis TaxID=3063997 RepID=A0ABT9A1G8_9SPHN|nr:DUF885 family protein [Sphingomonas sp. CA1-15]MDO7843661.1 DUF885 family protein [Sphingomonas sp. CA1-15]
MKITRREVMVGAGAAGIAATLPAVAATPAGDATVQATLAGLAEEIMTDWPENALALGIDNGKRAALRGRFGNTTAAAYHDRAARCAAHLKTLKAIDRKPLSPGTALDLDVAESAYALADEGFRTMPVGEVATLDPNSFRNTPYLVSQLGGAYSDLPDLLENKHQVAGAADADAYLSRLEAFAAALDGETPRIRADAVKGAIPPVLVIDITSKQLRGIRATPAASQAIITSFTEKCAKAGLPASYTTRATAIFDQKIAPALDRQITAFDAIRPNASEVPGLWQRKDGDAYYRWLVKAGTTTNSTPEEIHALGVEQNRAINAEIDTLLKGQGLTQGSVGERLTALSKRPDLLFSNDDAGRAKLLAYLNGRIADIRTRLPRGFNTLVKGNLVIKRVPPAIEDGAPNGYAGPGSIDGKIPGMYYINLKSTATWPRYSLPTLCYHEGIPGHIWQGEYSNQLPLIRSLLAFNAYSEGWALYAEQLAGELGVYDDDPLGRIGYLQSMNFRACRLVVDTGIHAKRWTFQQALDWFQAGTGMPVNQLTSELQRYCAMPGQACGYKMGHNEINRLRDKAKAALGKSFDLKAYDDVIVKTGNVPLTLLERVVDRHVAESITT